MLQLQWTPRTRSTGISDGWAAMQSQLREKEGKDRAKHLENREALYRGVYRAVEMTRAKQLGTPTALGNRTHASDNT